MMNFGVYFKKIESMGTGDFVKWKENHQEEYNLLVQFNQRAKEYCQKHEITDNILDSEHSEEARSILQILTSMSSFQTNFANNLDTATSLEGFEHLNWEEQEAAFFSRYPGLELKDYFSDSIEVFRAQFQADFDSNDEKLFPKILMAEGSIEIPISLQEGFAFSEDMTPFYGIFADVNFALAGCWYAIDYGGGAGWYESKEQKA